MSKVIPVVACSSACASPSRVPVTAELAGQRIETTVDSPVAAYYLEHYLRGESSDVEMSQTIESVLKEQDPDPFDREALEWLSRRVSTDFATIHFVVRLYERPANRRAQDAFRAYLGRLEGSQVVDDPGPPAAQKRYLFAFVPGFAYKKDTTTGADFARQRALFAQKGYQTLLIETDELGSVERNAEILAGWLDRLARREEQIILVSASKAGPEVALALSDIRSREAGCRVRAWISVGGVLRGSAYADRFLHFPRRWFAGMALAVQGLPSSVVEDLSTEVRGPAFARIHLPERILMMQYIGAPLSGQIMKSVRGQYNALRSLGPNDGLTLLADELVPGGIAVTDVGLDHYYRDTAIDIKTLALTRIVLDELERENPSSLVR
jgi:hypothetical protein